MKIAISGKGGSGKTTISATLIRLIARRGLSVLAIDGDPNPNLIQALGVGPGVELGQEVGDRSGYKPVHQVADEVGIVAPSRQGRRLIGRAERTKLVFGSDLDRASAAFERHGGKAILIGHLIPGVGALISVPAGLKRMPVRWRFLGYTVIGGISWTGMLVGLGWSLGRRWRVVELYASFVGLAVLVVLVSGILWFLWRRWRAHR